MNRRAFITMLLSAVPLVAAAAATVKRPITYKGVPIVMDGGRSIIVPLHYPRRVDVGADYARYLYSQARRAQIRRQLAIRAARDSLELAPWPLSESVPRFTHAGGET